MDEYFANGQSHGISMLAFVTILVIIQRDDGAEPLIQCFSSEGPRTTGGTLKGHMILSYVCAFKGFNAQDLANPSLSQ